MLNKSVYKNIDISDNSYKNKMNSHFNPYEYNFESNMKNNINMDEYMMKSKSHEIRQINKK